MKYGQQLEHESVPEWSLHNLDYNSLKHEIKVHTTRDQATAIAIPGQQDTALKRFEENLYLELCRQHDRVHLFVVSKADELSRRLEHVAGKVQRWVAKGHDEGDGAASWKRQRRFSRYERELLRCGEELLALSRFANAQVVAFRKILKKYKKWTGSTTLTARFNGDILSNPKSFTRRTFDCLQNRYDEILGGLQAATPPFSEPSSPDSLGQSVEVHRTQRSRQVNFEPLSPAASKSRAKYWNEYDDGSEAGGIEDDYAIYINQDDDTGFPGLAYVNTVLSAPYAKAKKWFKQSQEQSQERQRLLTSEQESSLGYASTAVESEEESYASSDGYPQLGYTTIYALPSVAEQRVQRYREKVLTLAAAGCFAVSFALLGITGTLILTGKHRLRVEVDAGVTLGAVISLFCAGSGLGMTLCRRAPLSLSYKLMNWSAFLTLCILNGMLLFLMLGTAP